MDFMDIDQVVEVPDTPDRFVPASNSCDNSIQNGSDVSKNYRNDPREKGTSVAINGNRRLFVRPDSCSNSSGSLLKNTSSSKNVQAAVDNRRTENWKALCNSNIQKSSSFVDLTDQNGRGVVSGNTLASRKCLFSANGFPAVDALDASSKSCRLNSNLKIGPRSDHGKGVATGAQHNAENGSSPRVSKQKRLVRNGCISPLNIAKSKPTAEKHGVWRVAKEVPNTVDIKGIIAEAKDSHRLKGKGASVSHRHLSFEEPDARIGHSSQSDIISSNLDNRLGDLEIVSSQREPVSSRAHQLGQFKERAQLTKRQREGAGSSNTGECATSHFNDPEIVFLSPSGVPSTSRSTRNKNRHGAGSLDPVIALDDSSPEPGNPGSNQGSNPDSGVTALQVEADEMLARELQEQLYNEEMDSHHALAVALQQENSLHDIHARGRPRPAFRGPSVLNLYRDPRSNSSRNPPIHRGVQAQAPSSRLARLRGRFPGRPRTLSSTTIAGSSIFPPNMNVDMRMQILEALEAFNDMELPNDLLQAGHEFNENDYEILLALDENNHQHGGATHAQINNLPQSTVQAENQQECAICLETPSVGETIRHLPCLHRFHKDCIDQWLRRKTSCPVCKSSVT